MAKLLYTLAAAAAVVVVALLAAASGAMAADADPIFDFCVADLNSTLIINGLVCRNPATVTGGDFKFTGFEKMGDTNNSLGSSVIPAFAGVNYPALNTQGLAMARLDYAKGGLVPPHTHPRATEVIYVVKGSLLVGFVDTSGVFYPALLHKGDVFVFPRGLVHFQLNVGKGHAFAIATLNSQNPGVQLIANALFALPNEVLAKAFGVPVSEVLKIKGGT